jgi:hypothetical protein
MDRFTEICLIALPVIAIWHVFFIFIFSDSKYQKYRFRKALETIYSYSSRSGRSAEMSIMHKNRLFTISVQHKPINAVYSYYELFINDEFVATFHVMKNLTWLTYYLFRAESKRHSNEVRAIIYAADRFLKQEAKPKPEKKDGHEEYSYFK